MESTDRESISKHIFLQTDSASRRERCCQSPVRGEASRMAKAYAEGRRPACRTAKPRGREGGCKGPVRGEAARMAKAYAEGGRPACGTAKPRGREGGDSRGKRVGESIPDGWRPEASPPAVRMDAEGKVGG